MRPLPLVERKARLKRLLRRRSNHLIAEALSIEGRGRALFAAVAQHFPRLAYRRAVFDLPPLHAAPVRITLALGDDTSLRRFFGKLCERLTLAHGKIRVDLSLRRKSTPVIFPALDLG